MSKIPVYNLQGQKKQEITLNPAVFSVAEKSAVLQRVVEAILANRRHPIAATKDRGEVRGGGIKPWRQKGTGRARVGSIRSPLWKGGGITFGPSAERNFSLRVNQKERRKALMMALSDKAKHEKVVVVEEIKLTKIKTKSITELLSALKVIKKQQVLIVLPSKDNIVAKSVANLPEVKMVLAANLNAYEVLKFEYVLFTVKALQVLETTFVK